MAHTHEFDCKLCGAHLDSRQDLDRHNHDKHPSNEQSAESKSGAKSSYSLNPPPKS
jgi:hypothetical protein